LPSELKNAWTPATWGEELFLLINSEVGKGLNQSLYTEHFRNYHRADQGFQAFFALTASFDVFVRCLKEAVRVVRNEPLVAPPSLARKVRVELDIPPSLTSQNRFGETLKQAAKVVIEDDRPHSIMESALRGGAERCYLCGATLTKSGLHKRTADHLWPLAFGGQTIEANLLPACQDCNSKRGNLAAWFLGPVHSTQYGRSAEKLNNPAADVQFSIGLARLQKAAVDVSKGERPLTLSEAARSCFPLVPTFTTIPTDQKFTYFELLEYSY